MTKNRKKSGLGRMVGLILLVLVYLAVIVTVLLQGQNVALFNPKGWIAEEQHKLMVAAVGIMFLVAVPAVSLFYFMAWRYRESNHKARHDPNAGPGKLLVASMWLVPITIAVVMTSIMIPATHRLEPQKQIASDAENLTIQVVAMRWKWLFIYPEQNIATVNYVQIPVDTPVTFELTADEAPMSSFWIPNLGGMLYAMSGHTNRLNLMADTLGEYPGSSAEINGAGFAGMKFVAHATSKKDFDVWARELNLSSSPLSTSEYDKLVKPSENNPIAAYSLADSDLYAKVVMKYMGSHEHQAEAYEGTH